MKLSGKAVSTLKTLKQRRADVYPGWDLYRDGITQGLLGTFLQCPEKLRLAIKEGWSPVGSKGAIVFGDIFHNCLEQFYTECQYKRDNPKSGGWNVRKFGPKVIERILSDMQVIQTEKLRQSPEFTAKVEEDLNEQYFIAEVLLSEYVRVWAKDFEEKSWVHLEAKFNFPYYHPTGQIPQRGKIDGLYRAGERNRLHLFETKTKSRIDEVMIENRMSFDPQVMLYLDAAEYLTGELPVAVCYNVIQRPLLRQGAKEDRATFRERVRKDIQSRPEHYFRRFNSTISKAEVRRWRQEYAHIIDQLVSWHESTYHYRNPATCSNYGVTCPFIRVCGSGKLDGLQKRTAVFPELEGED